MTCRRASLLAVDDRQCLQQGAARRGVVVGPRAPGASSVQGLGSDLRASKPILLHIRAPAPLQDAQPACRRAAASARSAAPTAMILTRMHGEDPSGYVGRRPRCLLRLRGLASLVAAAPPAPPDQASHDGGRVNTGGEFLSSKRPMLLIFCLVVKIRSEGGTGQPPGTLVLYLVTSGVQITVQYQHGDQHASPRKIKDFPNAEVRVGVGGGDQPFQ